MIVLEFHKPDNGDPIYIVAGHMVSWHTWGDGWLVTTTADYIEVREDPRAVLAATFRQMQATNPLLLAAPKLPVGRQ